MPRLALMILAFLTLPAPAQYLTNVRATASSEQVKGLTGADNLVNDRGLTPSPDDPAQLALTNNLYDAGGCMWHANYLPTGAQDTPLIDFDFGRPVTVARFRVWNHNANPSRGFDAVTLYASDDAKSWRTIPQKFRFTKAPGKPGYLGEEHALATPVTARYLRFWADSSHRGGQPDVAGLGKVRFVAADPAVAAASAPSAPVGPYPFDAGVIDVTRPPYSAKANGQSDDTAPLQRAIDDNQGGGRTLYLPAGTYLLSAPLKYKPGHRHGHSNLQGAGRDKTILRLKDNTFTDPARPQPVLFNGFNGSDDAKRVSADWFHNHFTDFTIDTGRGNPGAIALQFYSNNLGLLKNVTLRSGDGAGVVGLDLAPADQNGPLLVKNVAVSGFDTGVRCAATVNSQTIETLRLDRQNKVGVSNAGQCLTLRDLQTRLSVPALDSKFGVVTLIDATLTGDGSANTLDAVTSREILFARNVRAPGYRRAIHNAAERNATPSPDGTTVAEFVSAPVLAFGTAPKTSLNLPVKDAPADPPPDPPAAWANVRHFRATDDPDDTAALQRALDSGAATVYLPPGGGYAFTASVNIPPTVRRLNGFFNPVRGVTLKGQPAPALRATGDGPPLLIENLRHNPTIVNAGRRTLVVRNCEASGGSPTDAADLFLENVVGDWTFGKGQSAWCRQMNTEREGTHLTNAGANLWILGLKTERGGTLVDTTAAGRTEILGGLSYTTTQGKLAPMFRLTADAHLSATLGEVCYTGDPYATLFHWDRPPAPVTLKRGDAPLRPAFLQGSALPFLRAGD